MAKDKVCDRRAHLCRYQSHFGATVILHGESLVVVDAEVRRIAAEQGLTFIHPYDDAKVIAGQGTCAKEVLEDYPSWKP